MKDSTARIITFLIAAAVFFILGMWFDDYATFRICKAKGFLESNDERLVCRVEYKEFPKESAKP